MHTWLKKHWKRYMLRPLIYKTFTRFVLALTVALLWDNYVRLDPMIPRKMFAFFFLSVYFVLCAWLVHMRMDGLRLPRFRFPIRRKHDPVRTYGDMMDYTDEEIVSFDELEDDEKDICSLLANLICFALFLILSFVV